MQEDANAQPQKTSKKTATELRKERAMLPVLHPGLAIGQKHHVFIAKLKRGELWALNHLSQEDKGIVTPLFEMWPPTVPRAPKVKAGQKAKPAKLPKSLSIHSRDLLTIVSEEWRNLPIYLDTQYVPKGGIPTELAAGTIFEEARKLGVPAVPVTALRFTQAYQVGIASITAKDGRGVMIRLQIEDFTNSSLLPSYLEALLSILKVKESNVDILVDLKHRPSQAEVSALGQSCLSKIPNRNAWWTVLLASGGFPSSITNWPYAQWVSIERSDWLGWLDVVQTRRAAGVRTPSFGDYGVRCGGEPLSAARRPDPNMRYTTKATVITRKGSKDDGQMIKICADLITKPEYVGPEFSKGDSEIKRKATASGFPNNGQAEQWIQWSTNHHLTQTAKQIRSSV